MSDAVLFVDDEQNVLDAHARQFRNRFPLWTASSAAAGLVTLEAHPEIGVVVSDMQMPITNGAEFLASVRAVRPDTVRFILTGHADVTAAIASVNSGAIFRFLQKPCSHEELSQGLEAAFEQRRLARVERELLEKTLTGAVEMLAELLEMANPALFSRSFRILRAAQSLSKAAGLPDQWELRVAALLSQIGCLAVSPDAVAAAASGATLTEAQELVFRSHPEIASKLLARIPRLEGVADVIAQQLGSEPRSAAAPTATGREQVSVAELLEAAVGFDQLVTRGFSAEAAVAALSARPSRFSPAVIAALPSLRVEKAPTEIRAIRAAELVVDMILEQDVRSKEGVLLVAKGKVVTETVMLMLRSFGDGAGITEPFLVRAVGRPLAGPDLGRLVAREPSEPRGTVS
jgi:FixJ family two-component response regulator